PEPRGADRALRDRSRAPAQRDVLAVGPAHLGLLAVPALGLRAADGHDVHPVRPGGERAHDLGIDAHEVPLAQLDHLAVEQDLPGAGDHQVGLLLLAVAVAALRAEAGRIAPVADADVARAHGS